MKWKWTTTVMMMTAVKEIWTMFDYYEYVFHIVATVATPMLTSTTHIVLCIFPLKFFVFIAFSNENKPHVISNVLEVSRKATAWRFYINTSSSLIDWVMNKERKKNITLSQSHTRTHTHTFETILLKMLLKALFFLLNITLSVMCE